MITLAEIFSDGMVLQRNTPVRIFGESTTACVLSAEINGEKLADATVNAGRFELALPPLEAKENATLTITSDSGERITLKDVDVGEVWIAGGQSNMEFLLAYDREGEDVIRLADDRHLRFYDVGEYAYPEAKAARLGDEHWDRWLRFLPEEAPWFSAVGTYFALTLRKRLDVPVGIVSCNWGGTTASTWMDADLLRSDPELRIYTEDYDRRIQAVNREQAVQKDLASKRRAMKAAAMLHLTQDSMLKKESTKPSGWFSKKLFTILYRLMQTGVCSENRPGGLYEAMLSQIVGYSCSGVIWYQGESDDNHAEIYDKLFTAMIACWRSKWRQARLPFFFVQLAPFEEWTLSTGKNYPLLREKQQLVEDQAEDTYMASIMDAGSRYDIHPKDKRPVGERLARLALDRVYEISTLCRAPRITEWKKKNGALTAVFGNVEDALTQKDDCAELFQIRAGGQDIPVFAKLSGREIELQSELICENERYEVAFAYVPYCRMSVYGNGGLAARPSAPTMV